MIRRISLLVLLAAFSLSLNAQKYDFATLLGSIGGDSYGHDVAYDAAGNAIYKGTFEGSINVDGTIYRVDGTRDAFILKTDPAGNIIFFKQLGFDSVHPTFLEPTAVATDANNNIYIIGSFAGDEPDYGLVNFSLSGRYDVYVMKLDPSGNLIWATNFGGNDWDYGHGIAVDAAENVYVTGRAGDDTPFNFAGDTDLFFSDQAFIARINSDGTQEWIDFPGNGEGYDIAVNDGLGKVYAVGEQSSDPTIWRYDLASVSSPDHVLDLTYEPTGAIFGAAYGVGINSAGEVIMVGDFRNGDATFGLDVLTNTGGRDLFVAKLDANLTPVVAISEPGTDDESAYDVSISSAAGFVDDVFITGYFRSADFSPGGAGPYSAFGSRDIYIAHYDIDLAYVKSLDLDVDGFSTGNGIAVTSGGSVYTAGRFDGRTSFGTTNYTNKGTSHYFNNYRINDFNTLFFSKASAKGEILLKGIEFGGAEIFVVGEFKGTVDIDGNRILSLEPGANEISNDDDLFIGSFNTDGTVNWIEVMGSTGDDEAYDVTFDGEGSAYAHVRFAAASSIAGFFPNPPGETILKVTTGGAFNPTHRQNVPAGVNLRDMEVDWINNRVLMTGDFSGSNVDFGGPLLSSSGSLDIFLWQVNNLVATTDAKAWGSTGPEAATDLSVDVSSGEVYITGWHVDAVPFGGSAGTIPTDGSQNIFVLELDNANNPTRAFSDGGAAEDEEADYINIDDAGNISIAGNFYGATANIAGSAINGTGVDRDWFVAKYDNSFTGQWAYTIEIEDGSNSDIVDIEGDSFGGVYLLGTVGGFGTETIDFGGVGNTVTNDGDEDAWLAFYDPLGSLKYLEVFGTDFNSATEGEPYKEEGYDLSIDSSDKIWVTGGLAVRPDDFGAFQLWPYSADIPGQSRGQDTYLVQIDMAQPPDGDKIYWSDEFLVGLSRANIDDGSGDELFLPAPVSKQGVVINPNTNTFYVAEPLGDIIFTGNINDPLGTLTTLIDGTVLGGGSDLRGLAIDLTNGKLYWADNGTSQIGRVNLDGSFPEPAFISGPETVGVFDLEIDDVGGRVIWTRNTGTTDIWAADLTSGNVEATPLIASGTTLFLGLAVNTQSTPNKMYWINTSAGAIFSAELDGSNPISEVSVNVDFQGCDLEVDPARGLLYYANTADDEITSYDLTTFTPTTILTTASAFISSPRFIALDYIPPACPFANAGTDDTNCEGDPFNLNGTIGGTATTATWTSNGDGSFDDPNNLNAIYTPGPGDISGGTVLLTLTTDAPTCSPAVDTKTLTIDPAATVNAGADLTICQSGTANPTAVIGGSAATVSWFSSGDGSFDNNSLLSPVYTPGAGDIGAGTVTLTVLTNNPPGPCSSETDDVIITISPDATAAAGSDQTICEGGIVNLSGSIGGAASTLTWNSSGDGTFDDNTLANAVYTPGATDISTGSVTLTIDTDDPDGAGPCTSASDNLIVTIEPLPVITVQPVVTLTECEGNAASLTVTATGTTLSYVWQVDGGGGYVVVSDGGVYSGATTSQLDISDVTGQDGYMYLVNVIETGGTLSCSILSDESTLTVNPQPTANAGPDQTVCEGSPVPLNGTVGGAAVTGSWTTSGDGTFDDPNLLNATYTPGPTDIGNTITLTLTSEDPDGPGGCVAAVDDLQLTTDQSVTLVNAGVDQSICPGATVSVTATFTGTSSADLWTTSGDGSFDTPGLLSATYSPGALDIAGGSVTLTFTASGIGVCPDASDQMIVTIAEPLLAGVINSPIGVQETVNFDVIAVSQINAGDVITVTILQNGTQGTATILGDNTIDYTSNANTIGPDQVEYEICNQCGQCDSNFINLDIENAPPSVNPDPPPPVTAGESVTIPVASFVSDLNGNADLSSLTVVVPPVSGANAFFDSNFDLVVDYTNIAFTGQDVLTIEICDLLGECSQTQIFIDVEAPGITVYNAVSPDGDGKHDFLEIEGIEAFPGNTVEIYNRWGSMVFSVSDYDNSVNIFNGQSDSGSDLPSGTYFYIIQLPSTGQEIQGFFMLKSD